MKLTTRGRYAVTAMLDLAIYGDGAPISLVDIAARQSISLSYLEQLFNQLKRAGLVTSIRGPGGGYQLNMTCEEISVSDVVIAVNEGMDATLCSGKKNCHNNKPCLTHDLWADLSYEIKQFLDKITLADLVKKYKHKQADNVPHTMTKRDNHHEYLTN